MKKNYLILALLLLFFCNVGFSQITFFACASSFTTNAPNEYNLILEGTDATGRNYYQSNPISGDQPCSAGACEFRIAWNEAQSRWEILLVQNNIDFSDAVVVYHNETASSPNPPSLNLGTWIDTTGSCGGTLTESNGNLSGDVQDDLTLSNTDNITLSRSIQVYPNPAQKMIFVQSNGLNIERLALYSVLGKVVNVPIKNYEINVSNLTKGIYLLRIDAENNKNLIRKVVVN
ncbi:T9SS type A sorting domain-containing protein [Tamlana sp. 62-3]|uniref:T9SS type A sorting domain-containing protein n=1 Tax=Neotamlana sargassicola TaxID=2883125 RepID=A0A9X1I7G8_9FLAO|nr:T9SS type A sorting domain-containing protein [Tamlana sargassicola]MCB4808270.1 T9SS type A sorting domain-containing protein [Tamlana sargassicola]